MKIMLDFGQLQLGNEKRRKRALCSILVINWNSFLSYTQVENLLGRRISRARSRRELGGKQSYPCRCSSLSIQYIGTYPKLLEVVSCGVLSLAHINRIRTPVGRNWPSVQSYGATKGERQSQWDNNHHISTLKVRRGGNPLSIWEIISNQQRTTEISRHLSTLVRLVTHLTMP